MAHLCKTFLVVLSLATFFNTSVFASGLNQSDLGSQVVRIKKSAFHDAVRKLWEDHITWTRLYLVSALADLPDKDFTAKRLLQNQVDIGDAMKPFYENEGGG